MSCTSVGLGVGTGMEIVRILQGIYSSQLLNSLLIMRQSEIRTIDMGSCLLLKADRNVTMAAKSEDGGIVSKSYAKGQSQEALNATDYV